MHIYDYFNKTYTLGFRRGVIVKTAVDAEPENLGEHPLSFKQINIEEQNEEIKLFEGHRTEFIKQIKKLRQKHPNADAKQLEGSRHQS